MPKKTDKTIFTPKESQDKIEVIDKVMKKPFNDLYVPMITPTKDNRVDDQLTLNLISIAQMLKKEYVRVTATASTIQTARSESFILLKRTLTDQIQNVDTTSIRGFMVDSDIRWDTSANQKIVDEVRKADIEKYNFVIPYRIRDTTSILVPTINTQPQNYHRVPIQQYFTEWENYKECDCAGLGFYYGDLPLDYTFYFSRYGEDMNFFLDNKIKPKVINSIDLYHIKLMQMGLKEVKYL